MKISIEHVDAFDTYGETLVLKHAQYSYGLDRAIVEKLSETQPNIKELLPLPNNELVVSGKPITGFRNILFVGVPPISSLDYSEIRAFVKRGLKKAKDIVPNPRKMTFTLHGVGYGLNMRECFLAELNGIKDALEDNLVDNSLMEVNFIEKEEGIVESLNTILEGFLAENHEIFLLQRTSLRKETFIAFSKIEKLHSIDNNEKSNLKDLIDSLGNRERSVEALALIENSHNLYESFKKKITSTALDEVDKINFTFSKLNPFFLDLQLYCEKLNSLGLKEIAWGFQLNGLNYLISIFQKMNLDFEYLITKKKAIKKEIKYTFLNSFGEKLIPRNKFPWDLVGEILEAEYLEDYWDKIADLSTEN